MIRGPRWTEDDYRRELRRLRAARPLHQQQSDALQGRNPITSRWWPRWKTWKPTGGRMAQIMSRFSAGYYGTGRAAGLKRTATKAASSRENARKPRPRARLRARKHEER
jgi:hypothetical protein